MAFGTRFNAATRRQLRARSTPPSGASPEAIWHQFFDTQPFVTAATTRLTFFQTTNVDATITNMPAAGQLPDPQWLSIYDLTCDFLTQNTSVVGVSQVTGELGDLTLLLKVGRPTWVLTISDKRYGPYSLTLLHATGGPVGFQASGNTAASGNAQYANNAMNPGWNYQGSLIIPPKTNFNIEVVWAATQVTLETPINIRLSLHGILSRRTL